MSQQTRSPRQALARWLDEAADVGLGPVADRIVAACNSLPSGQPDSVHTDSGELSGDADSLGDPPEVDTQPDGASRWAQPRLIGLLHERVSTDFERTRRGAWYTPPSVVVGLFQLATTGLAGTPSFVVDPACGGGGFLLTALDYLVDRGLTPAEAVTRVGGLDIDSSAVDASSDSIRAWAATHGLGDVAPRVELADALGTWPSGWPTPQLIIGNPPFASPLKSGAVSPEATSFREQHGSLLGPYADLAASHLLRSIQALGPRGRVCFVLPQSVLAGRDTDQLREWLAHAAPTVGLWATDEKVFNAGVRVFAPVLERAGGAPSVAVASGVPPVVTTRQGSRPWSDLAATALGVPMVGSIGKPLGERVSATSGFRDEFYGLAAACMEAGPGDGPENDRLQLLTAGSLEPLRTTWGQRPIRLNHESWTRPVVALDRLDPRTARWVERQRRPKVLLPTQTRIFEPVIDRTGDWVGTTPVVLIHADPDALDHVAALLLAPPVVAWAARRYFGSALSVSALKVAARQIPDLPAPVRDRPWDQAARLVARTPPGTPRVDRERNLRRIAELMTTAYDADERVLNWWLHRAGLA